MESWIIYGIAASLVWGIYIVLLKIAVSEAPKYKTPPHVAFFAMSLGILAISAVAFMIGRACIPVFSEHGIGIAFASGLVWGVGMGFVVSSLSYDKAIVSKLTPLYNTNTLVAVLLAIVLLKEVRGEWLMLSLGAVLVVVGGILVTRRSSPGDDSADVGVMPGARQGMLPIESWVTRGIIASLAWGIYAVLLKMATSPQYHNINPFIAFTAMSLGILVVSSTMLVKSARKKRDVSNHSRRGLVLSLLSGLLWGTGMIAVTYALSYLQTPVAKLVPLYNTNTLVTFSLGILLLHEIRKRKDLIITFLGAFLVIIGGTLVTLT